MKGGGKKKKFFFPFGGKGEIPLQKKKTPPFFFANFFLKGGVFGFWGKQKKKTRVFPQKLGAQFPLFFKKIKKGAPQKKISPGGFFKIFPPKKGGKKKGGF
ncbi:MAG: hypothetical protein CM15mV148_100 [uncultured marine virus]|nr:MAG: hypothetical protein CM15mV148_100 [uncultured marine virus]